MNILYVPHFLSQLADLNKKFRQVRLDVRAELENFSPLHETALGQGLFKMRVKNSDIPCGKSGGYRLIVFSENGKVVPILIYSKREKVNVSEQEIGDALEKALKEI